MHTTRYVIGHYTYNNTTRSVPVRCVAGSTRSSHRCRTCHKSEDSFPCGLINSTVACLQLVHGSQARRPHRVIGLLQKRTLSECIPAFSCRNDKKTAWVVCAACGDSENNIPFCSSDSHEIRLQKSSSPKRRTNTAVLVPAPLFSSLGKQT